MTIISVMGVWATAVTEKSMLRGWSKKRRQLVNSRVVEIDLDPKCSTLSDKGEMFYLFVLHAEHTSVYVSTIDTT